MATRFIWTELEIRNKIPQHVWKGEFIFNYYNEARQLLHHLVKTVDVTPNPPNHNFFVEAGCGDPVNVSWEEGNYSIEVVFMGKLIAVTNFKVADQVDRGKNDYKVIWETTELKFLDYSTEH
jgi:hypothetical protein